MNATTDITISLWKLKLLGWICGGFFTFCLVSSWASGQLELSIWFLPLILLAVPILIQAGTIHCDSRAISLSIPLGEFEIEWAEIERVEQGQSCIAFIAGEKRLNIPKPEWWAGADRKLFANLVAIFLQERGIEIEQSFLVDYKFPKNTRKRMQ